MGPDNGTNHREGRRSPIISVLCTDHLWLNVEPVSAAGHLCERSLFGMCLYLQHAILARG